MVNVESNNSVGGWVGGIEVDWLVGKLKTVKAIGSKLSQVEKEKPEVLKNQNHLINHHHLL